MEANAMSECSRKIMWQTVLFWMICFALNSASQLTGKVLGLSFRHKGLRVSPVVYFFDAITVLVIWIAKICSRSDVPVRLGTVARARPGGTMSQ